MIVFDVGANNGADSVAWMRKGAEVHAFEPAPAMLEKLRAIDGLIVVPAAVSDYAGEAIFRLAEHADHGTSSLLDFNQEALRHWLERTDLSITRSVMVPVIRLDGYMIDHGIQTVDYLHCDAQGSDLAVLRGLGERYVDVRAGRVEAATRRQTALYRNQPLEEDIVAWLTEHGFTVTKRESNDQWGHEVNLEFSRT